MCISCLTAWNALSCSGPHTNGISFFLSAHKGVQWLLPTGLGTCTSPGNSLSWESSIGPWHCPGVSWQVWLTLSCCLAWYFWVSRCAQKNFLSSHFNSNLSALNLVSLPLWPSPSITVDFHHVLSLWTKLSSATPVMPGRPSWMVSSLLLKDVVTWSHQKGVLKTETCRRGCWMSSGSVLGSTTMWYDFMLKVPSSSKQSKKSLIRLSLVRGVYTRFSSLDSRLQFTLIRLVLRMSYTQELGGLENLTQQRLPLLMLPLWCT